MPRLHSVFAVFIFLLSTITTVRAEERPGTITGHVTDADRYVLPGARIELQPGGLAAVSDQEGKFTIVNVKPGTYTITVSYVGLSPLSEPVTVHPGQTVSVDTVLPVPNVHESVTVRADRPRGEAAAINQQRTAANIVQVLPAEVITSLPNTNVADAVGRLPSVSLERDEGEGKYVQIRGTDPRLSNLTINGVHVPSPESGSRNVKLDIIPSDIVGSIEVNKTLSANQDGDAIGGSVNLVTKLPGEKPYFSATALGGYTNIIGGRGLTQFGATAATRSAPNRQWGILAGGTYDWNGRGIDDLEPSPGRRGRRRRPDAGIHGPRSARIPLLPDARRALRAASTTAGPAGSSAYVRSLFSNFHNYGDRWVYSPGAGDFLTPTITDSNGTMDASLQNRRPNEQIFSLSGGAKHAFGVDPARLRPVARRAPVRTGSTRRASTSPARQCGLRHRCERSVLPTVQRAERRQRVRPDGVHAGCSVRSQRTHGSAGFRRQRECHPRLYPRQPRSTCCRAASSSATRTRPTTWTIPTYSCHRGAGTDDGQVLGTFANPDYYSGHYHARAPRGPEQDPRRSWRPTPSALELIDRQDTAARRRQLHGRRERVRGATA